MNNRHTDSYSQANKIQLNLRELRQGRELSQDELARQLGISRQSIISLERGEYLPSSPLLLDIICFFECSLNEIFSGRTFFEQNNNEKGGENEMQITRWDPFQAIDKMHDELDDMLDRNFSRVDWPRSMGSLAGALNIHETDREYEIEVQVPGYKEDEINIEMTENSMTISGAKKLEKKEKEGKNAIRREWEHSEFSRTIHFATPIKDSKAEAKLEDGTLSIIAPKVEPVKPKTTKIAVKKTK